MGLAGAAHLGRAVALGEHHHGATGRLELVDEGVHTSSGRRSEGAGRHAFRGFRRTGVVDRVVLDVIRQRLAGFEPFAQLGVGEVARHDQRAGQRQAGLDRMFGELREDLRHRLGQVDLDDLVGQMLVGHFGHVFFRVHLELLQENAVLGDLAHRLAVCGTGHADADRQRRAVARQADHADVVAEIFAAELGADTGRLGQLVDFLFHGEIAERMAEFRARCRQVVEIARGGELHGLQVHFGGGAADDDRQVIGRAGGRAERQDLLLQELDQTVVGQKGRRALEQEGLVGRSAALGHEQELVGVLAFRIELDLRRHVVGGVLFLKHRQRRELRIAQVLLEIGIARAFAEGGFIGAVGPDPAALLAHDDGRAGVLAHGQDACGRNAGVLQKVEGDELVVFGCFRIVQDLLELFQVAGTQVVVDILEGFLRQKTHALALHHEHFFAVELGRLHVIRSQLAVGRGVLRKRKQAAVLVVGRRQGSIHGSQGLSGSGVRRREASTGAGSVSRSFTQNDRKRQALRSSTLVETSEGVSG